MCVFSKESEKQKEKRGRSPNTCEAASK
eukprot:COSAG06_NODE_56877_length_282_cov_1.934426_1_plen_27_part_01